MTNWEAPDNKIGLSVDTILLSSSKITDGITIYNEISDEKLVITSLSELPLDVGFYTENQNRIIRHDNEVSLISASGECIAIPIPRQIVSPLGARYLNTTGKLEPSSPKSLSRSGSSEEMATNADVNNTPRSPRLGVVDVMKIMEAEDQAYMQEELNYYDTKLRRVPIDRKTEIERRLFLTMERLKYHYMNHATPMLELIDNTYYDNINNSPFVQELRSRVSTTGSFPDWQRANLVREQMKDVTSRLERMEESASIIRHNMDQLEADSQLSTSTSSTESEPPSPKPKPVAMVPNLSIQISPRTIEDEINAVLDTPRTPEPSLFRRKLSTAQPPPTLDVESLKRQFENIPEECFTIE